MQILFLSNRLSPEVGPFLRLPVRNIDAGHLLPGDGSGFVYKAEREGLGMIVRVKGATAPAQTAAKMRENTTLPLRHATQGHSRMPMEGVLQQPPPGRVSPEARGSRGGLSIHPLSEPRRRPLQNPPQVATNRPGAWWREVRGSG